MGGFIGLDYAAVNAVFEMVGVKDKKAMFSLIQEMELAALPVLNKKGN